MKIRNNLVIEEEEEEEEERRFYERYCQNENRIYQKTTFFGLLKRFILARISNDEDIKDKDNVYKLEQFWDNFLMNNTTIVVFIHSANILLLLITVGFLCNLLPMSYSILMNCFIWFIVSIICLLFIIWYKIKSQGNQKQKKALQMWTYIGHFILYIRLLKLISQLTQILMIKVLNIGENINDPLKYVVLSIAIDFVQLVVFSTIPFPTPINFYITLQEFILQITKILFIVNALMNPLLGKYILACSVVTITNWHVLILISALNVEAAEKATFRNVRALEITSHDKNKLISLICSDTKSIVKDLAKAAENIKSTCVNSNRKIKKFTSDIVRQAESTDIVADNLLLLTRIADGKWTCKETWVNVNSLVNRIQNDASFKNLHVRFSITLVTEIKQNILMDADSVTILLRNSLFYWYQSIKDFSFAKAVVLKITCKLVKLRKRKQQQKPYMLVFKIFDTETAEERGHDDILTSKLKPSKRSDIATKFLAQNSGKSNLTALVNLASTCNGYCEIDVEPEYIEFGIPCSGWTNEKGDAIDSKQRDVEYEVRSSITKIDKISRLKVFVVSADFIKSQMIHKLLERVGVSADSIKTIKSLSNSAKSSLDLLLSSDLALVDSITSCEKLSALGYYGLVVLISNEDSVASNLVHYCLPLYCLNTEIVSFQDWLGKCICKEALPKLPELPSKSMLMNLFSRCFYASNDKTSFDVRKGEYTFKRNSYKNHVKIISAHSRFDHRTVFLTFSKAVEESYRKVRILNPTSCWSHPTATGYWTLLFYAFQALAIGWIGTYYTPGTTFRFYKYSIFYGIVLPMTYFKDKVFRTLSMRLGLSAITYSNCWGAALLLSWTVGPILTLFYVIRGNSAIYVNPFLEFKEEQLQSISTMNMFYFESYGGYTGREYVDSVFIHTIYLTGTVVFFLQWPYNVLIPLLNWIKLCLYSSVVMYKLILLTIIEVDYVQTVAAVLSNLGVLVLISVVHFEWINRSNYQVLRKVLDCSDFTDDCYKLCHSDLVDPLKQITECHQQVLKLVLPLILRKKVILTLFLKDAVDSFNMQILLIDLLAADLSNKKNLSSVDLKKLHAKVLHDSLHEDEYKDEKQALESVECDTVYLKLEIQEISAIVSSYYSKNDFAVKIFTDVDDSLSIVRTSKKFLRILLTSAILNSIAVLKQDTYYDSIAGSWHEIHISAEPQNESESIKFTDLRWMRVVVKDSRSALRVGSNKVDSLLNYNQYKSREVIEMLLNFDTYSSEKPCAYSVLKLPYRLHPCHQQVLGVISKAKRFKLKIRGSDSLLESYNVWSKSSHATSKSYSVLIVQYTPDDQSTLLLQSLRSRGWLVVQVSSIRVVEFSPNHLNCDCIIIDYSRYYQVGRSSRSLLDEISIIKLLGYKGIP